jgi:hypothetical protein
MHGFGADMAANAHAAAGVGNRDEIHSKASAAVLSQTVRALGQSAGRGAQGEQGHDCEATASRGWETEKLQVGIHPWLAPWTAQDTNSTGAMRRSLCGRQNAAQRESGLVSNRTRKAVTLRLVQTHNAHIVAASCRLRRYSAPVADRGLHQRQRGDGGRVGAEDARPQR